MESSDIILAVIQIPSDRSVQFLFGVVSEQQVGVGSANRLVHFDVQPSEVDHVVVRVGDAGVPHRVRVELVSLLEDVDLAHSADVACVQRRFAFEAAEAVEAGGDFSWRWSGEHVHISQRSQRVPGLLGEVWHEAQEV